MEPKQPSYEKKADSNGEVLTKSSEDSEPSADKYPHGIPKLLLVVSVCISIFLIALDQVRRLPRPTYLTWILTPDVRPS